MEVHRNIQCLYTISSCRKHFPNSLPRGFLHKQCSIFTLTQQRERGFILPRNCFKRRKKNPFKSTVTTT
uniref:Lipid-A-disaccharide synthase n=1 Tax=Rhizophora mucronata TaxID=61149 RepID=A0A2P2MRE4_RHIMU